MFERLPHNISRVSRAYCTVRRTFVNAVEYEDEEDVESAVEVDSWSTRGAALGL